MIEVKNVTKKYGNFVAVDDISFEVKDNEVVGFLGPNGAGKSTTMNMITGYIESSKGRIIINGYDISKTPTKAKKEIGYMPENVPLYPDLTVKEFVNYMADLKNVDKKSKKEEVNNILKETGLTDVQNKLIKKISRGYKQRVSLAGALIGNPDVLILDEPTVGLDPKQVIEIRELIKSLGKHHTVILSSHILSEVSQICEKVIIINKGKILAVDTPANLEKKTKNDNNLLITVEDKNSKMKTISKKIKDISSVKLIKDNKDGTLQYLISSDKKSDIRKEIFNKFPKEGITIFELKKTENTLEDAFLKIIDDKETEIKSIELSKAKEKANREKELNKMSKEDRKVAIKEDKKKEKQIKKEEFEKEYEKDKALAKTFKEEDKKLKEQRKFNKKNNASKVNKSSTTNNKNVNANVKKSSSSNSASTKTNKTTSSKTSNNNKTTNKINTQTKAKITTNKSNKSNSKKGGNK